MFSLQRIYFLLFDLDDVDNLFGTRTFPINLASEHVGLMYECVSWLQFSESCNGNVIMLWTMTLTTMSWKNKNCWYKTPIFGKVQRLTLWKLISKIGNKQAIYWNMQWKYYISTNKQQINTGTVTGLKLVKTQPMSREKLCNSFRKSGEQLLKDTLKNLHSNLASCLHIEKWMMSWDFCTVVYLLFKSSVCKRQPIWIRLA